MADRHSQSRRREFCLGLRWGREAVAGTLVALVTILGGCATKPPQQPAEVKRYAFWPEPPDEPHIQFLASINSSADIEIKKSGWDAVMYGKESDQVLGVSKPYGVAMWNGRIYVCDVRGNGGVIVLDLRKHETRIMGGGGQHAIKDASDVAVSPEGAKYVVDQAQSSVIVFDQEERGVATFPLSDCKPLSVAVYKGLLYVTDAKGQRVLVLDRRDGRVLRTVGEPGGEDGQFIKPLKVAVDPEGNLYVSDTFRARIQKFSPDGKFLLGFGQHGDRPGTFKFPKHLAVSADNVVFVADAGFSNVQLFDELGRVMMYFGAMGDHPGSMDLPAGLTIREGDLDLFARYVHPAFEAERLIVVTNQFGPHKVSIYAMGHLKPGKTLADITNRAGVASGLVQETTQPATAPAAGPGGSATRPVRP